MQPEVPEWQAHDRRIRAEEFAAGVRIACNAADVEAFKRTPATGLNAWANEWAGEYRCGMWEPILISVGPRGGVVYRRTGCLGLYDLNYGDIERALPDRLIVKLRIDPSLGDRYMSRELFLVRWGDRRYIVPGSGMVAFCNAHNSGALRAGFCDEAPLRDGDLGAAVRGLPTVPEEYRALLLQEPVNAEVIEIREVLRVDAPTPGLEWITVRALVNVGAASGIAAGMEFHVGEDGYATLTVASTEEQVCVAEYRSLEPRGAAVEWPVKGSGLSTASWLHSSERSPFKTR